MQQDVVPIQKGDRLVFPNHETEVVETFTIREEAAGEEHEFLILIDRLANGEERRWQCNRKGFEYLFISPHHENPPTLVRDGEVIVEGG